ncbi:hypothetical protein BDV96DRAFT_642398 [Lophiotrema nucula]|uniref:Uncharacterized protein n=1 Tax=Lophiotrema nucula TaxID=690887 RepID=A0A6A5ZIV7_9PLEO|nr:hypothetical protein BDV96DRAFT_642398 [Lophiotrema nucula]
MSKRCPATSQPEQDCKRVRRDPPLPSPESVNLIRQRNAQESPLLRLPAELRNRIYELVVGGHLIHVEAEDKKEGCSKSRAFDESAFAQLTIWQSLQLKRWCDHKSLHYYPCTAASEGEAYDRFLDASALEFLPGDDEVFANNWRLGDRYHVLSCKERHAKCLPQDDDKKPEWMWAPIDRSRLAGATNMSLFRALEFGLLQTCSQIHHEAKDLPLSANTFSVRDLVSFLLLACRLGPLRAQIIKSIHIVLRLGRDREHWAYWLAVPKISHGLSGVRHFHLSLLIIHAGMGDDGPFRDDFFSGRTTSWLSGLDRFRALPLSCVTVILSDDPDSKFGIKGFSDSALQYGWSHDNETWLQLREHECLTAEEKRRWAKQLKSYLLNETSDLVLR